MTDCPYLFIGGDWRAPESRDVITVRSPATERVIGSAPCSDQADVDAAVAAARHALTRSGWPQWTPDRRADAMDRLADALEARAHAVAAMITNENGMPISLSTVVEGFVPTGVLRYYVALARSVQVEERRPAVVGSGSTLVRREPVGVVAAIVPWNSPALVTSFKLAPALATGCTLVIKPSPETAWTRHCSRRPSWRPGSLPGSSTSSPAGGRPVST